MHSDDSAVAAEAVAHLPVVEATVLDRVDAKLAQTQPYVHVLQVNEECMEGSLINQLCHVTREHVPGPGTERGVLVLRVQLSGHVPLTACVSDRPSVYDMAREETLPRLCVRS